MCVGMDPKSVQNFGYHHHGPLLFYTTSFCTTSFCTTSFYTTSFYTSSFSQAHSPSDPLIYARTH
eukprot:m.203799 g.203799  ORF g.203799 m.203799 type:complete len:65 (-) comp14997_c0_seq2:68-262(-)